jgi:hypothetical protein
MIRHQRLWTISHGWLSNIGLAFSIVLCEGASMASRTRSGGPYLLATRYRPGTTSTLGSGEASAFSVGLPGRAHRGLSSSETNDRTMASVSGKNKQVSTDVKTKTSHIVVGICFSFEAGVHVLPERLEDSVSTLQAFCQSAVNRRCPMRTEHMVGTLDQQSTSVDIASFGNAELRVSIPGLAASWPQAEVAADIATSRGSVPCCPASERT